MNQVRDQMIRKQHVFAEECQRAYIFEMSSLAATNRLRYDVITQLGYEGLSRDCEFFHLNKDDTKAEGADLVLAPHATLAI